MHLYSIRFSFSNNEAQSADEEQSALDCVVNLCYYTILHAAALENK